ncbi:MAG: hypothetical protein WC059_02550 [Candidatus Paceibacterota bacterium]
MTSTDLIKKFELPSGEFSDPIPWEKDIGFSIFKDRNDKYASLYKIGFGLGNDNLKKLWVTATYGKKTDDSISIGTSKNLTDPVDLDVYGQFFFNIESGKFFHYNKEIEPNNILNKLKKAHLKPTRIIVGLPLRIKLFLWRRFLPTIIKIIDRILSLLLEIFTGEVVKDKNIVRRFIDQWHEESDKKPTKIDLDENIFGRNIKTPKEWSFLGFKSTRWSVVFYSILHIFLYFFNSLFWKIDDPIIIKIFESNFLTLCYVAISFSIIEFLIPYILKLSVRKIPKIYQNVAFKRLKVSI